MRVKDRMPSADFHVDSVAYPVERSGEIVGSLLRINASDSLTIQTAHAQSVEISELPRMAFAQILAQMAFAMAKDNAGLPLTPNQKRHALYTDGLPEITYTLPKKGKIFMLPRDEFMTIGAKQSDGLCVAMSINKYYSPNTFRAAVDMLKVVRSYCRV